MGTQAGSSASEGRRGARGEVKRQRLNFGTLKVHADVTIEYTHNGWTAQHAGITGLQGRQCNPAPTNGPHNADSEPTEASGLTERLG